MSSVKLIAEGSNIRKTGVESNSCEIRPTKIFMQGFPELKSYPRPLLPDVVVRAGLSRETESLQSAADDFYAAGIPLPALMGGCRFDTVE